jgi:hypothetical protein
MGHLPIEALVRAMEVRVDRVLGELAAEESEACDDGGERIAKFVS